MTQSAERPTGTAEVGVTGLAVMGANLARNLASKGFRVAVHNRSQAKTDALIDSHGQEGEFIPSESMADFVQSLATPRKIIIMVKAGQPTDAVIDELVPLLDADDIIVDAGNAQWEDTRRREQALREKGFRFVGTGVSGGEEGALLGPSIMPGGDPAAYAELAPMLEKIAAQVDGEPCCRHIGPDAAGHFVKMVHNGIEYADMQLIAEAYDVIRTLTGASPAEIAESFRQWNTGVLDSYLIEITATVLDKVDERTDKPLVDVILDAAAQKGTGTWTVQSALTLGVPTGAIAEAVFARAVSSQPDQRAAVRKKFGDAPFETAEDKAQLISDVEQALYASKIVAYAQGFDLIQTASKEFNWDIEPGDLATIWRGGCIIRAAFLDRIKQAYEADPQLWNLLVDDSFAADVTGAEAQWRKVVGLAIANGVPVPAFSASLAYFDSLRRGRLPAALVQAQRDFFGAHTYRRVDAEGSYHVEWSGDGAEVSAD
ncbi:NADP-dependent phosphogluconate dehydrogenase [Propionibacteriaceae bacterium Y1700]|uniref:NADP-dependent phosphogluconate dehydrogenase n=1 Tax=Microlunatus sp. Y1700 TaxID=3418487 RepID=UPI003DA71B04